jgi:hypothetical protein
MTPDLFTPLAQSDRPAIGLAASPCWAPMVRHLDLFGGGKAPALGLATG